MSDAHFGRHIRRFKWIALATAVGLSMALASGDGAVARPHSTLHIKYYTITGPDDRSLDQQMERFGPMHRGAKAYATLSADPKFDGRLVGGKSCRLEHFRVNASFVMTLPKLAPGVHLSPATAARWRRFAAFVRRHEDRHRAIWLGCLARGEARALKLRVSDCSRLDAAVENIFKQEWARCETLHDAWDAEQQVELKRQPLIIAASKFSHQAALTRVAVKVNYRTAFRGGREAQ